jgi:hypothetical protein
MYFLIYIEFENLSKDLFMSDNRYSLFSQTLVLLEREKANCFYFHVEIAFYFEKRATNFIQMHKLTFTTLKSAFRF